jgi:hypothetical protein
MGVFMCGAAFLLLAVERLSAPVLTAVPVAPPVVAAASRPTAVAARVAPIIAVRHPKVRKVAAIIVAVAPAPSVVRPLRAPPQRHARQPKEAKITTVHRPAAKPSPMPRLLAIANAAHRPRIAVESSPKNERTPEPPIGYDDRPALVSADGPNAPMTTMAPVQVELTTKNLGR